MLYVLSVEVAGLALKSIVAYFHIYLLCDLYILLVLGQHRLLICQLLEDVEQQTVDISSLLLVLVQLL